MYVPGPYHSSKYNLNTLNETDYGISTPVSAQNVCGVTGLFIFIHIPTNVQVTRYGSSQISYFRRTYFSKVYIYFTFNTKIGKSMKYCLWTLFIVFDDSFLLKQLTERITIPELRDISHPPRLIEACQIRLNKGYEFASEIYRLSQQCLQHISNGFLMRYIIWPYCQPGYISDHGLRFRLSTNSLLKPQSLNCGWNCQIQTRLLLSFVSEHRVLAQKPSGRKLHHELKVVFS